MIKVDAAAEFPQVVRALVREGIPVFAQFGLTPQTAGKYGIPYSAQNSPEAQASAQAAAKLVDEAKMLEDAGASLLDFTNSGPVAGAAVVAAVKIPVIGGFGGGPVARRPRAARPHRARLRREVARFKDRHLYQHRQSRARRLHRADRGCARRPPDQGLKMPSVDIDGIATRYEIKGSGPADPDVCAGRLQRDHRSLVDARHLRQGQAARSSAAEIHLHPVRPPRMRPIRRPRRAGDLARISSPRAKGCSTIWESRARISWAAAWAAGRSPPSASRIRTWSRA